VPTAWEREQERERKARYLAEREAETRRYNELLDRRLAELGNILPAGLSRSAALDHNARKLPLPVFDAGGLDRALTEPTLEELFPHEPSALARLIPGWKGRHEKQRLSAQAEFSAAHTQWQHLDSSPRLTTNNVDHNNHNITLTLDRKPVPLPVALADRSLVSRVTTLCPLFSGRPVSHPISTDRSEKRRPDTESKCKPPVTPLSSLPTCQIPVLTDLLGLHMNIAVAWTKTLHTIGPHTSLPGQPARMQVEVSTARLNRALACAQRHESACA